MILACCIGIIGVITWLLSTEGIWGAASTLLCVVISGLLAMNFFEPAALYLTFFVPALAERYPTLQLHIVGSGYWEDALRAHAQSSGVGDRVNFHGFVTEAEKHRLLAESWVVLMPSQKEGWGLTIVEAGLHATPAIAFAYAGGVTESIVAGETGLLAADVPELVAQVDALLADNQLRGKYGANARRHARSFSWERTGTELEGHVRRIAVRARG